MKIRKGFVSNSSSSSFICDVCGNTQTGYDMSLEDAEMFQCESGHTFCEYHMVTPGDYQDAIEDESNEFDDSRWDVPSKYCPICQMEDIMTSDILHYLLKKNDINENIVAYEIREKFKTYDEFSRYLKK